jgi:tetratricopeptide (TPR) repeat protein
LHKEVDDRYGEAATWDSLGYIHHQLGHHAEAVVHYQHALDLCRSMEDRYNEAGTLTHLGDAYQALDNPRAAREVWRQALTIFNDLKHPDAEAVLAKLHAIDTGT